MTSSAIRLASSGLMRSASILERSSSVRGVSSQSQNSISKQSMTVSFREYQITRAQTSKNTSKDDSCSKRRVAYFIILSEQVICSKLSITTNPDLNTSRSPLDSTIIDMQYAFSSWQFFLLITPLTFEETLLVHSKYRPLSITGVLHFTLFLLISYYLVCGWKKYFLPFGEPMGGPMGGPMEEPMGEPMGEPMTCSGSAGTCFESRMKEVIRFRSKALSFFRRLMNPCSSMFFLKEDFNGCVVLKPTKVEIFLKCV